MSKAVEHNRPEGCPSYFNSENNPQKTLVNQEVLDRLFMLQEHVSPNTRIVLKDLSVELIRVAGIAYCAGYFIFSQSDEDANNKGNRMAMALMIAPLISNIFSQSLSNIGRKVSLLLCPVLVTPGMKKAVNYRSIFEENKHLLTHSMREFIDSTITRYTYILEYHNFDVKEMATAIDEALHLPIRPKKLEGKNSEIKKILENYPPNVRKGMATFVSDICSHSHLASPEKRITPLMLVGPPGTGKTFLVRQTIKALGLPLCEIKISEYRSIDGNNMWSNDPEMGVVLDALLKSSLEDSANPPANVVLFIDEPDKVLEKGKDGNYTHPLGNMVYTFLHTLLEVRTLEFPLKRYYNASHSIRHIIVILGANSSFSKILGEKKAVALESRVRTLNFDEGFNREQKETIISQFIKEHYGRLDEKVKVDPKVISKIIDKDEELKFKGARILIDIVDQYIQSLLNVDEITYYAPDEAEAFDVEEAYKMYSSKGKSFTPSYIN